MAVTFPTKFDVREARDQAAKVVSGTVEPWREPSLAVLGFGDVAVSTAREAVARVQSEAVTIPTRLTPREIQELGRRYVDTVRAAYTDLVARGEVAYARVTAQPQVKRTLAAIDRASDEVESRVEDTVEEFRVRGEHTLGRFTTATRSVGERAARNTQHVSGQVARTMAAVGGELAEEIDEAGDKAASQTRSTARKTAARTAPNPQGPKNAPRSAAATSPSTGSRS